MPALLILLQWYCFLLKMLLRDAWSCRFINNLSYVLELSSIVHQSADAGGRPAEPAALNNRPGGRRSFWSRLCCCIDSSDTDSTNDGRGREYRDNSIMQNRFPLLGPRHHDDAHKKCLVLDLDETLVHSSFKPVPNADYIIPVEIENVVHRVYVLKRPGVDRFLSRMAELYELVVYTASLSKYADPLLDKLDPNNLIRWRLFREHCVFHQGHYVKDLSILGRPIEGSIIIDNSPMSYLFHPEHAIGVPSFIDDPTDHGLDDMTPFLEYLVDVPDVRQHMSRYNPLSPTKTF